MPIYEYQCEHCGQSTEFIQKLSDAPHVTCPLCGQDALKKTVSRTSFQLKGSGWYVTDFKDKNKPKTPEATPTASKASAASTLPTEEKKTPPSTDNSDKTK